jgi:hypothetical protein
LAVATSAALLGSATLTVGIAHAANTPTIQTVAGNGTAGYSGDGHEPRKAELNTPTGVAENPNDHSLYIADTLNNRIRKVTQSSQNNFSLDVISTLAGNGTAGYGGDGNPATSAELNHPGGVAVDPSGNVYIADSGNNRIREVAASTSKISTIAGNGTCSSLCLPTGIAYYANGTNQYLFISDTGHNVVRQLNLGTHVLSTFAGNGQVGSSGDTGLATNAKLAGPTGVATDTIGDVYIADSGNCRVRVVETNLDIYAFAGTGSCGFGGDAGSPTSAQLKVPTGIGVDPLGDVFITDTGNSRIRAVTGAIAGNTASATIATYAGTTTPGYSGDGGAATSAQLRLPTGDLAADGSTVYFADTFNQRVRGIYTGPPPVLAQSAFAILLPISGAVVALAGASGIWFRRRRHPAAAVAA